MPLKQIRELLGRNPLSLARALRFQRRALAEKGRRLGLAVRAIQCAEQALASGAEPTLAVIKNIIEVIEMENKTEWMNTYYSEEALAKVEERKALWSPELQEKVTKDWQALVRDIEAALAAGEHPAGAGTGRALAGAGSRLHRRRPADSFGLERNVCGPPKLARESGIPEDV